MSAASMVLDLPEVRARISPITVAQYQQLSEFNEQGRRTELIRGVILEKISKSPLHSSIARRLYKLLQTALPAHFTLLREDPLTLSDSEPEPDLAIVRGDEFEFVSRHPSTAALVIEIAVSSAAEDRSLAALYAEAGVEEYWIVLPLERRIEVYRRPERGIFSELLVVEGDTVLTCKSIAGVQVGLAELFA
jgi:Uma2 family endonuclease